MCYESLILADKKANVSYRMETDDGIAALDNLLSLTTCTEEYLTVLLHNIDTLVKHYSRTYVRMWRFRRHYIRQSVLSSIMAPSTERVFRSCNSAVELCKTALRPAASRCGHLFSNVWGGVLCRGPPD